MDTAAQTNDRAHGHDEIRRDVRVYIVVFAVLLALTLITVAVSYLHLPTRAAIAVALTIAVVKGSLVGAFFMHLISERKVIYALLLVAALLLVGMFALTLLGWSDQVRLW